MTCSLVVVVVIAEEVKETRAEVKSFDKTALKHVDTAEKEKLPSAEGKQQSKKSNCILF